MLFWTVVKEYKLMNIKNKPILDPDFVPAALWNKEFKNKIAIEGGGNIVIALERPNGTVSTYPTQILKDSPDNFKLNLKYVERLVKFLLWMKGGEKVTIAGDETLAEKIAEIYSGTGKRKFDNQVMTKIYGKKFTVENCSLNDAPQSNEISVKLGGNMDGCRIGFDLGGSDRKCSAVIDGKVIYTEEIEWDPYFQKDPHWHKIEIMDTLKRAAEKLPRVDAIGGSSAGVYVDNKVRVASLFRGVSEEDFEKYVVNMFLDIQKEWNNIPFVLVNDGEVTALAGAMEINDSAVLGISMGTSMAVGYVNPEGNITDWLNELAFAPIDYKDDAPADEWSGDIGCGVQYFSQQAVARLAPKAGIDFDEKIPFPERLIEVQKLMKNGDERARKIYETIGTYFGYAIAQYSELYDFRNLLILGRVTSGEGGNLILATAEKVLRSEFPKLAEKIKFRTPDEKNKRHGQAVAAASLPAI